MNKSQVATSWRRCEHPNKIAQLHIPAVHGRLAVRALAPRVPRVLLFTQRRHTHTQLNQHLLEACHLSCKRVELRVGSLGLLQTVNAEPAAITASPAARRLPLAWTLKRIA